MGLWLSAVFLLLGGDSAPADSTAEVRCREIAFSRTVENRDLAAFTSFLDTDARFVGDSVLHGREEITAAWQVFFTEDGPSLKWRPQFVEVLDSGDIALTRGPFRLRSKSTDGQAVEQWGTFNTIWRKDEAGEWRVVFDAGSAAAAPPPDEQRALLDRPDAC